MPCTICQHPRRQEIDQALVAGSASLAALSQQYSLSTSALHRHKAHLQAKVSRTKDRFLENLRQGCLFWLSQALEMTMQTAQAAQVEGNSRLVLKALAQGTRLVTTILKQDFPMDDRLIYEILTSPQWITQAGLLPYDPGITSRSRQAVAETLATPCPENVASDSPADLPLNSDALQALFTTLLQPAASANHNRKPKTENRKLFSRGGKLPGKTPCLRNKNKEYQIDMRLEKNSGKIPSAPGRQVGGNGALPLPTSSWLQDLDAGRLDIDTLNAIGAGRPLPDPLAVFQEGGSLTSPGD